MVQLVLAALFFCGVHFFIAGTSVRAKLIGKMGKKPYRIAFSILSALGLLWLIGAYRGAPYIGLWGQLYGLKPLALFLMLLAFLLVITGLTTPNPTAVSQSDRDEPAQGILRITRYPLLWGIGVWALTHLLVNGDLASFIFFGAFLALVSVGTRSIDAKRKRRFGEQWARFASATSNIPFLAIWQGRNRFSLQEIGWWRIILAVAAYALMLRLHKPLFGVSPLL